jgi:2-polyprenyl-3-methyl-5-hydroxy-6-metoxy-1,4-benzoquinol methylase
MATETIPPLDAERQDAFVERLFGSALGALDWATIYVGDRLGLYRALTERGPLTPAGLAKTAGVHERYAREWLEQQAVSGIVEIHDRDTASGERRYTLPAEHAGALLDTTSLAHIGPLARAFAATYRVMPQLLEAFRTGGGVPYAEYGADFREAQAAFNRPQFLNLLGEWLPAMPDVHERLQADPPARVADVACGAGWSSIAIARAYPKVRVDGYDSDEASIDLARANAADAGLEDRLRFHLRDASEPPPAERYDLVAVFEAIHDMSRPVEALRALRELAGDGGAVIVMDERTNDELTVGDPIEQLFYGFSVVHCLPVGMAEQPSAGTGTVMRTDTLRRYADEAGFGRVEVLPIEHDLFRFYRLHP